MLVSKDNIGSANFAQKKFCPRLCYSFVLYPLTRVKRTQLATGSPYLVRFYVMFDLDPFLFFVLFLLAALKELAHSLNDVNELSAKLSRSL